jgi:hypothetical protein
MKRKALILLSLISLLALISTSCYWRPDSSLGSLRVDVSGIASRLGNTGDVIRVYLIADGLLFSAGGEAPFMAEVPASGDFSQEQKINISGLPVGPEYRVMVGLGPVNSGIFQPYNYADSGRLQVSPNADTAVRVTLQNISYPYGYAPSFSPDLLGLELTGVVQSDYYDIYAAKADYLYYPYYGIPASWSLYDSFDLTSESYRVNSLSRGASFGPLSVGTYLNSNKGIYQFTNSDGFQIDASFSSTLSGTRDIRGSSSLTVPGTDVDYAVFFRRNGGLGGTYVPYADSSDPSLWKWVNVEMAAVTDMTVSEYNAYYAANGKVFVLAPAYLRDPALAENRKNLSVPAPVQSLGFRPYVSGSPGGTLYMGTTDGVWEMDVDESTSAPYVTPASSPIQAVAAGDRIERIAINSNTTYHEAYLSRYYLYIAKSLNFYKIPFFAVIPGRATGMAWDNSWNLYISGTEGLSALYAGS